jgi:hypothetical protein
MSLISDREMHQDRSDLPINGHARLPHRQAQCQGHRLPPCNKVATFYIFSALRFMCKPPDLNTRPDLTVPQFKSHFPRYCGVHQLRHDYTCAGATYPCLDCRGIKQLVVSHPQSLVRVQICPCTQAVFSSILCGKQSVNPYSSNAQAMRLARLATTPQIDSENMLSLTLYCAVGSCPSRKFLPSEQRSVFSLCFQAIPDIHGCPWVGAQL